MGVSWLQVEAQGATRGPPFPWQASNLHRGQGHPNDGFHCPPVSNCYFHSWRHYAAGSCYYTRGVTDWHTLTTMIAAAGQDF